MQVESLLDSYAEPTNRRLAALLAPTSAEPTVLGEAMRYSCLAPGKRIRPALCLASAEVFAGSRESALEKALDAACALEMVHCFSLIHDDLPAMDDDDLRRGLPTCHVKFGEAVAILAGDSLFATAYDVLSHAPGDPARVLECVKVLSAALGKAGLGGGQLLDVVSEQKPVDADTVRSIHQMKTGGFIAASCEIGALLGGADPTERSAIREFGDRIGLAFQIVDDVLDVTTSTTALGKTVGADVARGKATYPAVYGVDRSMAIAREEMEAGVRRLCDVNRDTAALSHLASFIVYRKA